MSKATMNKLTASSLLLQALTNAAIEAAKSGMTSVEIVAIIEDVKSMVESDES